MTPSISKMFRNRRQLLVGWMRAPFAPESTSDPIRSIPPQHLVDFAALHPPYDMLVGEGGFLSLSTLLLTEFPEEPVTFS